MAECTPHCAVQLIHPPPIRFASTLPSFFSFFFSPRTTKMRTIFHLICFAFMQQASAALKNNGVENYQSMGSGECVDASKVRPRGCYGNSLDSNSPISANQPAQCEQFCSQESSCFAFEAGVSDGKTGKNAGIGYCDILMSDNFVCPNGWNSGNPTGFVGPVQGTNSYAQFKTCYTKKGNSKATTPTAAPTANALQITRKQVTDCEKDFKKARNTHKDLRKAILTALKRKN